jgi:hypothetical protein
MVAFGYQISSKEPCILGRDTVMKNQAIKSIGIHNGLKILNICIFLLSPFWAYAQSTVPEQKVLRFYKKYMIACDHVFSDDTGSNLSGLFCNMDIEKYITKGLHKKIIHAYKSGTYGDLTGGGNYFTHTQDFDARWASYMTAKEIKSDRHDSVVRLFMNFPKEVGESLAVCVRLHREGNDWKIYQVDTGYDNNLPDCQNK